MCENIDGIDVGDYTQDQVCLNCTSWILNGSGGGMICAIGNGFTDPDDTCPSFSSLKSMDDDYNSYLLKSQHMLFWKKHR